MERCQLGLLRANCLSRLGLIFLLKIRLFASESCLKIVEGFFQSLRCLYLMSRVDKAFSLFAKS